MNKMEWFKWKHLIYIFKNNKIKERFIMESIKKIKDKIPSFISNILKMKYKKDIKKEMIYFYIDRNINIKNKYYINIF